MTGIKEYKAGSKRVAARTVAISEILEANGMPKSAWSAVVSEGTEY